MVDDDDDEDANDGDEIKFISFSNITSEIFFVFLFRPFPYRLLPLCIENHEISLLFIY
jgi:hypothetical protein